MVAVGTHEPAGLTLFPAWTTYSTFSHVADDGGPNVDISFSLRVLYSFHLLVFFLLVYTFYDGRMAMVTPEARRRLLDVWSQKRTVLHIPRHGDEVFEQSDIQTDLVSKRIIS